MQKDQCCGRLDWEAISVTEDEGKDMLMAVQSTHLMGYKNVVFESDCKSLVQNLNGDDNRIIGLDLCPNVFGIITKSIFDLAVLIFRR
ncbi:hypothetical protein YC2023_042889 [Brassica napus]